MTVITTKFSPERDKALVNLPEVRHERLVPRDAGKRPGISVCAEAAPPRRYRRGAARKPRGEGIIPLREMPRFSHAYTYAGRVYRRR